MKCPKCEVQLEDNAKFCVSCGANLDNIEETIQIDQDPSEVKENEIQKDIGITDKRTSKSVQNHKVNLVGMIVGTLFIVIGAIRIFSAGTSISPTSFGGDFYTYTYRGIVAISEILASIEVSLGWIIVAIGAAIDVRSFRH